MSVLSASVLMLCLWDCVEYGSCSENINDETLLRQFEVQARNVKRHTMMMREYDGKIQTL